MRWLIPALLLGVEYLVLSLLVDFPMSGPAMHLVRGLRLVIPVALGSAAGGYLLARQRLAGQRSAPDPSTPAWSPWPALALQPLAFAVTAVLARVLMGGDASPLTPAALLGWSACAATAVVLALATAAPLRWWAEQITGSWRTPLIALAIGVLSWRAAVAAEGLWGLLSSVTLRLAAFAVRSWAGEVILDEGNRVIGLRDFEIEVAPICSGADGIGLVVIFQAVWLALARGRVRMPAALLLLPLGALAAFGANVFRISTLVLVGASGHEALAMGAFHSKLGWVLFVVVALGSIALAERLPWLRRPQPAPEAAAPVETAFLAPLLATLAAALLTSLWSEGGLDRLYGVRIAVAGLTLFLLRRSLPAPAVAGSWAVPVGAGLAVAVFWVAWPAGDARLLVEALGRLTPAERTTWIALRAVGACVMIPVVEELAFRGFLLGWLSSQPLDGARWGASASAVLVSSLAFGVIHTDWIPGVLAGVAFALVRTWRGRLGDAVIAHVVSNVVVSLAVLVGGRWDLWR